VSSFKQRHEATGVMDGVTFLDVLNECWLLKNAFTAWNWLVFLFDSLFDEAYDVPKLYLCLILRSDFTRLRNATYPYRANSEGP